MQSPGSGADDRWDFHSLASREFEQLAATVLEDKYRIELLTFSEGRDGGRDAAARSASIQLDQLPPVFDGSPLSNRPPSLTEKSTQRIQSPSFTGSPTQHEHLTKIQKTPRKYTTKANRSIVAISMNAEQIRASPTNLIHIQDTKEQMTSRKRQQYRAKPSRLVRMRDIKSQSESSQLQRAVPSSSSNSGHNKQTLHNQNVVVQAKHTKRAGVTLDDGIRNLLFKPELKKVHKLAAAGQCDVYMVVLNYSVPAGQEIKVVRDFTAVGVKHVVVVGKETLLRWIQQSRELCRKIPDMYGIGGPGVRQISITTASGVHRMRKDLRGVLDSLDDSRTQTGERLCELSLQQAQALSQLGESQAVLNEVRQEVLTGKNGRAPPLRTMSRGLDEMRGRLQELTQGVHSTARAVDAIRRRMDYTSPIKAEFYLTSPGGVVTRQSSVCRSEPEVRSSVHEVRKSTLEVSSSEPEVSNSLLLELVRHYGVIQAWRFIVRYLGINEAQISEAAATHASPREQAYSALTAWRDGTPPRGSRERLERALRACALNGPADDIFKTEIERQIY